MAITFCHVSTVAHMPNEDRFGVIRLRGGRYERSGLPLAAASELARYERLVRNVARSLYLDDHPGRQRAPRGDQFDFELRLTSVESGSVVPVLERSASGGLFYGDNTEYFERSRVTINDALRSFNAGVPPRQFPQDCLDDFRVFGRTLTDNESFEFSDTEKSNNPAVLDVRTRQLISDYADLGYLDVETLLIGRVTGLRTQPTQFDFIVADTGKRVTGSYRGTAVWSQLRDVLGEGPRAQLAALTVVARKNDDGEISDISDVLSVELTLPDSWRARLQYLAELGDGWLDETSSAPTAGVLDAAEQVLLGCLDEGLQRPGIFPTSVGGIQLEWETATREARLTVMPDGGIETFWFSVADDAESGAAFRDDGIAQALSFIKEALS